MWTTRQLADELGAERHRIAKIAQRRRWTRWEGEWLFTDEQADEIRRTVRGFAREPAAAAPCSVDGCEAPAKTKGMCNAHYRRVVRHGSTEAQQGAHQRAKTHCPHGHVYDEANTYRFADGRRRCRACRLERSGSTPFRT